MTEQDHPHHGEEAAFIIPRSAHIGPDGKEGTIADVVATSPEAVENAMQTISEHLGKTVYALDDAPTSTGTQGGKTFGFGVRTWRAPWVPEGDRVREAQRAARAAEALKIDAALRKSPDQKPPKAGPASN